ncbi:hypothetical protein [Calothrix rhizosoleniae]
MTKSKIQNPKLKTRLNPLLGGYANGLGDRGWVVGDGEGVKEI